MDYLIKDAAIIIFLLVLVGILIKILVDVRKQTSRIKDLEFQLKAENIDNTEEK